MKPRTSISLLRLAALCLAGCSNQTPGYGNFGIDENPAIHVLGRYPVEKKPDGTPFRWTNGDATYALPPIRGAGPVRTLKIKVNAFHPTRLDVLVSGLQLASPQLKSGAWSGEIDVSTIDFGKPQSIELRTERWMPQRVGGYTRPLGVQVIDLELR